MPKDKKPAEPELDQDPEHSPQAEAGQARSAAPNQDVLPGILGKQLRAAYGELLSSPIPDVIGELIERLKKQEQAAVDPAKCEKPGGGESDQ